MKAIRDMKSLPPAALLSFPFLRPDSLGKGEML
jgi:hypothetical protein